MSTTYWGITGPCCCQGCLAWGDNFNRADSSSLGEDWVDTDAPGDPRWEIASNEARCVGDAADDSLAYHTRDLGACRFWYVTVDFVDIDIGDVFGIVLNYEPGTGNYLLGALTVSDATDPADPDYHDGWINICEVEGGTATALLDTPLKISNIVGQTKQFWLCYSGLLAFGPAGGPQVAWDGVSLVFDAEESHYAGLYNGNDHTIEFDNFQITQHYRCNPDCPKCHCQCEDEVLGRQLTATFIYLSGSCDEMDGWSMTLDVAPGDPDAPASWPNFIWYGSANPGISWCGSAVELTVRCAETATGWTLTATWCYGGTNFDAKAESTCSPFEIVFGPISPTSPGCTPPSYYNVVITR